LKKLNYIIQPLLRPVGTFSNTLYRICWKNRRRWQRVLLLLVMSVGLGSLYGYQWLFSDLPDIESLEEGQALASTRIYDRQGRLLYEIVDLYGGSHRTVPLDAMADCIPTATIATEDANFYQHPGVDIEGVVRAIWINVQGGEIRAGGSTITQQVVRNLLLTKNPGQDRSLERKLQEMILAIRLNEDYSRDEILALYLNQTYYGNLAYGVEAASRVYFGKSPRALSLAECAMLAGLPQAPADYNPLTNPKEAKARQEIVLDLMVKHGMILEDEAETAKAEPLEYSAETFNIQAPHFVAAVWTQLERDYGDLLRTGGLEVRTTLDLDWQYEAQKIAARHLHDLNFPPDNAPSKNANNAALVAIDPYDGRILAMLGSPDYFDDRISGNVNAALAPRQPGSALKPFTYAAAFNPTQEAPWTPATMVLDISTPFITKKLESYTPSNFGQVEHGPVLVREALASSYNIPAVVALDYTGLDALVSLTSRLGLSTLTDTSRFDLSLTLGGGEVRLLELSAAYAAFANGGNRVDPVYILDIKDSEGNLVYEWQPPSLGQPELDPRVAFLINDILSDDNARIPSFGQGSALSIGRIAAAKTGTTTDFRDNWTLGYTPNLVVGVWVGNADNTPMRDVSGISGAGPIWRDFMVSVLQDQPEVGFYRPEGIVREQVCAISGLLPTEACPRLIYEWFIEGTVPTREDDLYQVFEIDIRNGQLADEETPAEYRDEQIFLILPPEARDWATHEGIPSPPVDAVQISSYANASFRLLSPDPYTVFQLTPMMPFKSQRIRLNVVTPANTQEVRYLLDGEEIAASDEEPFDVWWELSPGYHELTAEAVLADGEVLKSGIIPFSVDTYVPPHELPPSGPAE
jgi:penicillin-binding protein 1C